MDNMKRRLGITVLLLFAAALSAFAAEPKAKAEVKAEKYIIDGKQRSFSYSEMLILSPLLSSADVLQFIQTAKNPDKPAEYYIAAANYTDAEIEDEYHIYMGILYPDAEMYVPFRYIADVEAYASAFKNVQLDKTISYKCEGTFTGVMDLAEIYPDGVKPEASPYDSYRTTAKMLALYSIVNGTAPSAGYCKAVLDYIIYAFSRQAETGSLSVNN